MARCKSAPFGMVVQCRDQTIRRDLVAQTCRRAQTPIFPLTGRLCLVVSRYEAKQRICPLIRAIKWTPRDERHREVSIKLAAPRSGAAGTPHAHGANSADAGTLGSGTRILGNDGLGMPYSPQGQSNLAAASHRFRPGTAVLQSTVGISA